MNGQITVVLNEAQFSEFVHEEIHEALPGASFLMQGATPAKNSALTSAGAELRLVLSISRRCRVSRRWLSRRRADAKQARCSRPRCSAPTAEIETSACPAGGLPSPTAAFRRAVATRDQASSPHAHRHTRAQDCALRLVIFARPCYFRVGSLSRVEEDLVDQCSSRNV
jgi:hypothetical protein